MKKILFLIVLMFFSTKLNSQVGINTVNPNSTLVVEGSYEGAYKEITANTTLTINDQYVTATGSTALTVTLPDGTAANSFSGRIYQIRNNSTQDVTLTGFGGTQLIRVTAAGLVSSYTIPPGAYVHVVKNNLSNAAGPLWELSFLGASLAVNIKTLTYVRKTVTPIDSNTPANSVVTIGTISMRFNGTTTSAANIEYNLSVPNHVTILYHKAGSGGVSLEEWGRQASQSGTWYNFNGEVGNATRDINPNNRDIGYAIIVLHNTKEVYRVTANVNGSIAASGSVPAANSSVTLFVEKLD
ncbi:MAG: hypothetical protein MUW56_18980 [Chryseobacterium sp.]|uniref:hypothetical protein n=1 Tax=Chryseobacterium sp. TaxID=1871047 RepID=UPI0025C400AF|nr:hypothetical protein [Chryseobacterium sp.]MCJ7935647.1 hypothetical protein [Chryseobacterium sp.]